MSKDKGLDVLLPALRQYRHNDWDGLVFGYDKDEVDRIVANLIEDRDGQYDMKQKARGQRDRAVKMLSELARVTEEIITISDREHAAWLAAKSIINKVRGLK